MSSTFEPSDEKKKSLGSRLGTVILGVLFWGGLLWLIVAQWQLILGLFFLFVIVGLALSPIGLIAKGLENKAQRARDQRAQSWISHEQWQADWRESHYGENHRAERSKYVEAVAQHGGLCMERVCVMPSRRIEAGAAWHLAHDHEAGGHQDYLGPTHPECNEAEARGRGVQF